jgi:hypothetical protein
VWPADYQPPSTAPWGRRDYQLVAELNWSVPHRDHYFLSCQPCKLSLFFAVASLAAVPAIRSRNEKKPYMNLNFGNTFLMCCLMWTRRLSQMARRDLIIGLN